MADQISNFLANEDEDKKKRLAAERRQFQRSLKDISEPSYLEELLFQARQNFYPNVNHLAQVMSRPFVQPQYSDPLTSRERSPVGFIGDMPTQFTSAAPMALNAFVFNPMRAYPRYNISTEKDTGGSYMGGDIDYIEAASDPRGFMVNGRYPGFVR